jgi:Tfp pilus assembly protein PilF
MLATSATSARKVRRPDRAPLVAGLLVFLLSLAVYAPVWDGEFLLWDDGHNVYDNPHIRGLSAENLAWIARGIGDDSRFKPLGWLSYALIHEAFGLSAPAYHRCAIILHGVNAVLLLAFLHRLLTLHEGWRSRRVLVGATFGALFWALHPLRVEGVAWISCLSFSVAMLFLTPALFCFLRLDPDRPWRRQAMYWLSLGCYFGAMLSFPVVITAFVLPLALAIHPLKLFRPAGGRQWLPVNGHILIRLLPYFLLSVLSGVLSMSGLLGQGADSEYMPVASMADFPVSERIMMSLWMEVYYLLHQVWPFPLRPVNVVAEGFQTWSWYSLGSAFVLVVGSAWLWTNRQRRTWALAAWVAHLGVLVPCLGFMSKPFQPGDRYLIVSGAILAALVGGVLSRRVSAQSAAARQTVATVVLLALGFSSFLYAPVWGFNELNFTAQSETLPDGQRRTMALLRLGRVQFERGDVGGALASYRAAVASDPEYPDTELPWNYATALAAAGHFREAIAQYERCLQLDPSFEPAWHQCAMLLFQESDRARAEAVFQQGLRIHEGSPTMIGAYANLLIEAGDPQAALSMIRFQERLHPETAAIRAMREKLESVLIAPKVP